jgi:hypothetical protein
MYVCMHVYIKYVCMYVCMYVFIPASLECPTKGWVPQPEELVQKLVAYPPTTDDACNIHTYIHTYTYIHTIVTSFH